MKIAIAGGSGFVGRHLTKYFLDRKYSLILISRAKHNSNHPLIRDTTWSELSKDVALMEGTDAIVNLAGESINQRWTNEAKQRILQSRLDIVAQVADIVKRMAAKPAVVVNASAVAIYGTSTRESFVEHSDPRVMDFLSGVVEQWERAMDEIQNTRIVKLRLGIVLGRDGGALPKMMTPYKFRVGGRIGSGRQVLSWIHILDLCRLIEFCIENEDIIEQINATAPQPVTNDEFGRALAAAMNSAHWLPVPAFMMKLIFGEMSTLLLDGQRALPMLATDYEFQYKFPFIEQAVKDLVKK
ncbi:TIGR01777 family oxidoreductase [Paenibacillus xerothermodurans]|uniref:TIGR01777 family protein n=1 Tax=Paenibacillus xerothermodurans TaxID=1977292 RepID=A0A2W1NDV6_PAEXE|nr:TIGR01777 family oxidoreductase [Paenibacillus xerothermodurans]PZE21790.1 TIGR01777 family protein [Paenibacillus xerothermodurans]